jgi:uncharacterized Zn-binding protein involved in type VI secretion
MLEAARIFDLTSHGGVIVGPGCLTVYIGGLAAVRMGAAHLCPLVDGLKPHVGGAIATGSATVWIEGAPAARVGDVTACAGPPGTIATGCPLVSIG